jgi:branched-subunit amino acid ABC-type transport system permease component
MAIGLAVGIIITYNVIGSVDTATIDAGLTGAPAATAASSLINSTGTFYTIAPIALIVVAAVAILGYVLLLRKG